MRQKISPKTVFLVFSILVICFLVVFYVLGWTEPTSAPPGGNVPAPINVGGEGQWKSGRLGVSINSIDPSYGLTLGSGLKITATGDKIPLYAEDEELDATPFIIDASGNVGIGTATPQARLDVDDEANTNSGIRLGNDTGVCNATRAGTMRYSAGVMQYCNGSAWQTVGGMSSCTTRTVTGLGKYYSPVTVSCNADEIITGGGCSTGSEAFRAFRISGNSFECYISYSDASSFSITASARCCK